MQATSPGASTIETGQLIAGHYRLAEHVGSGAMGVVWRAVDVRLERSVAVKRVVSQHGLSEADRDALHKRAMREAKIAARLQHPNAIAVYDITEHDGDPCLVMEYLPSRSLSDVLAEEGTVPVATAARIGEQVAAALVAAHRAGIVHRDVKPGNILIDDTGVAKLTDFGISRAHGDITLTQTGLVAGTAGYLAPELARGGDPSAASDVFALGATLYHALEGQSPYGSGSNQLALLHTAASGKVNPPTRSGPATALLMSLLRVAPEERATMQQASERLAAIASGGGVPAPPPPVLPARPPADGSAMAEPSASSAGPSSQPPATRQQPTLAATSAHPSPASTATFEPASSDERSAGQAPSRPHTGSPGRSGTTRSAGATGNRALLLGGAGFLALLVLALVLLINPDDDPGDATGSPAENPEVGSEPQDDTGDTEEPTGTERSVDDWGAAGELVVDYYTLPSEIDASWDMLTAAGQGAFDGKRGFDQYWQGYDQVYAQNARASPNEDGSVTISADVTFIEGGQERTESRELRIVKIDGELQIDSDTR
ncbi:Serine/threonine protein kinase [Haloechinothrix alba]|uniref:non-specific serine/threonine protein kinase n=2 Tax=Haloechinothrix alba TaxID=664784 RepID=A0A238X0R7_9PSEU|nr:serine/threonine-protein kinase [Haloechinothrix alba]SNR52208.1 Serine/threonine protein kinase [Haloechinothrix alba]